MIGEVPLEEEHMTTTTRTQRIKKPATQTGFSMMQLLIAVAVVSIVSSLAFLGIASARQRIRLTNSSRMLASYVEKARVDSVRRHPMTSDLMAGIEVLNRTTYRVKMDFDGNGSVDTRDVTLDDGVIFATDPIALVFDWRGRLVDLPLTEIKVSIAMQWGTDPNDQRIVDVTRSGDVTIDSDVYLDDIPNVNVNVSGLTGIDSGSTLNANNTVTPPPVDPPGDTLPAPPPPTEGDPVPILPPTDQPPAPDPIGDPIGDPNPDPIQNPNPDPTPVPSESPAPEPGPTPCLVTVTTSPSPLVFSKHGTGTISFSVNPNGAVTYNGGASNLAVSQSTGNNFSVQSLNNTRGNFTLMFNTPCGPHGVTLSVTN
jgi:hypothetical protein